MEEWEEEDEVWLEEPSREEVLERVYGCLIQMEQDVAARISSMQVQRHRQPQEQTALNGLRLMRDQLVQLHSDMDLYVQQKAGEEEGAGELEELQTKAEELEALQRAAEEQAKHLQDLRAELQQREEEVVNIKSQLQEHPQELQQMRAELTVLHERMEQEKVELVQKQQAVIQDLQTSHELEQKEWNREKEKLEQQLMELHTSATTNGDEEKAQLRTELELLQAREAELELQLQQERSDYNSTLSHLKQQLQTLKDEMAQQLQSATLEKEAYYQEQLGLYKSELEELLQRHDTLQETTVQLTAERNQLQTQLDEVATNTSLQQTEREQERQTLQSELTSLQSQLETLALLKTEQEATLEELRQQLQNREQLQTQAQNEAEAGWKKRVKQLRKEGKRLQQELLQEQERVKHQEESFRAHTQTVTRLDEELQHLQKQLKEEEAEKERMKQDNHRFRALLKQMSAHLKQQREDAEQRISQHEQQQQERQHTIQSLECQLQETQAAAERSSSTLASLSRTYCIDNTLALLVSNTGMMKLGKGQRPVFFPLMPATAPPPTTQQLYYWLELLQVLAFHMHCRKSSLLPGSEAHYFLLSKPASHKALLPHYQLAHLFFSVYALCVAPLLQFLAATCSSLQAEDHTHLLQQLESLFQQLFLPPPSGGICLEQSTLYLSDRDVLDVKTASLSTLPLPLFLHQLSESLQGHSFEEIQPASAASQLAGLTSLDWFSDCLQSVASQLLTGQPAAAPYPTLQAAKKHGLTVTEAESGGGVNKVQEYSQNLLNSLQKAAAAGNQVMWNRLAPQLAALHSEGRDLELLNTTHFFSIIQKARINQLQLRDLNPLLQHMKR